MSTSDLMVALLYHTKSNNGGWQKDRYRGTGGTKEGLGSIGRFRKQLQMLFILAPFMQYGNKEGYIFSKSPTLS